MTFLNPLFLWALPLLSLPVILHLIHKRPPKPLMFSYVPWLQAVHQAAMPKKKLKEWLLLLLRTLLIAFLVLFFSRPVLTRGGRLTGHSENSTILFLIDVSASMSTRSGGRTAFESGLEQISNLARQMPNDARMGFLAYSDRVEDELSPTDERARFSSSLKNLKTVPRPTDISSAVELAYKILGNQPAGRKSLVIVSDQAENGYETLLKSETDFPGYDPEVAVVAWEIISEGTNTGIKNASLALTGEGLLKGSFTAAHYGGKTAPPLWSLKLNGRIVGQGSLDRLGEEGINTPLQAQLPEGGFYSGQLDLTPDVLSFDDTYYVAGRVPKGFSLLMVDGESGLAPSDSEVYYVKLALESPRDPRLQAMSVIRPEALKDQNLNKFDVIVLANTGDLDETSSENLTRWIQQGGGLFLTAGSKWPKAPRSPLGLVRTQEIQKGRHVLIKPETSFLSLAGFEEFEWPEIEINSMRPLDQLSGATPLLKTEKGDPVLIQKKVGSGAVLVWLTSIDRAWTNFPAKPLFAPMMRELIASLADPLREQSSLNGFVGQSIRIKVPPETRAVTVLDPEGKSTGARVGEDGILNWNATPVPGLYKVQTNQKANDFSFAINIPGVEKEGNPKRIKSGQLKSIFPASSIEWVSANEKSGAGVLAALQGKDLTTLLAWFLIAFFIFETVLSGFRGGLWRPKEIAISVFLLLLPISAHAGNGNDFTYAQLQYDGAWDPYPSAHKAVFEMIKSMTNIPLASERKVVTLSDSEIFEYPFLLIKGNTPFKLTAKEKTKLKDYIEGGGFVFIDDSLANLQSPFATSVRSLFSELYPDRPFERLPTDHAVFRSFFLLRSAAGRRVAAKYLEGLEVGGRSGGEGRTAVIFCANDLLGAWIKDSVGEYAYSCEPGGEPQRWESFKLTLNIVYFSLTGTYKRDAIHQPFIERKLGL